MSGVQPRRASHARRAVRIAPSNRANRKHGTARIRAIRPPRPAYDRRTALCRVLSLWPQELDDLSANNRPGILVRLERALRAERRRGIAGHWTYDLARHIELLHVYRQEVAMQDAIKKRGAVDDRKGKS